MRYIRLLTSIHGGGPVVGDTGALLPVDDDTADVWADGVRAESVEVELVNGIPTIAGLPMTSREAAPSPPVDPAGAAQLRDELLALGVAVPADTDLVGWAQAVALWREAHPDVLTAVRAAAESASVPPTAAVVPTPAEAGSRPRDGRVRSRR